MHLTKRLTARAATVAATLAASTLPASVHPHVFAEARLDVILNPDQTVKSLQHVWRFDDLFSSTVLMEFDKNSDLKLDDSELEEVSKTVFDSLSEYNYFQLVTKDGKDVAMKAPDKLIANLEEDQLVILFESTPAAPLPLGGKIDFGVYDPTFYIAIDFTDDASLTVEGLPATVQARSSGQTRTRRSHRISQS